MEIPKPSEADKEYFRSLLPDSPEIEIKPMFGNLGAFVHGNMFAGLFGAAVGVRLADADRDELAAVAGAGAFGPAERPMGGYLSLPPAWRADPGIAAAGSAERSRMSARCRRRRPSPPSPRPGARGPERRATSCRRPARPAGGQRATRRSGQSTG